MAYQVLRSGVVATATGTFGPEKQNFDERAILPPEVPQREIEHLLSVHLIREAGGPPQLPVPDVSPVVEEPAGPSVSVPHDDPERVAARAKLPADGTLPHHNAGQSVWVEHLVGKGYDYDALAGQDKAELVDLAKKVA